MTVTFLTIVYDEGTFRAIATHNFQTAEDENRQHIYDCSNRSAIQKTASTAFATFYVDDEVFSHSIPEHFLTDDGPQFVTKVPHVKWVAIGTLLMTTTSYNPQMS